MAQCKWPGPDSKVPEYEIEDRRCQREAHPGHDFCLFHLPLQEKNQDPGLRREFARKFRGLYEQGKWDFTGFEFPDKMNMEEWDFRLPHEKEGRDPQEGENTRPVDFSFARFGDQASFESAHFGDLASFNSARFGYQASFWGARFGDEASFMNAIFGDQARFSSARFGDQARFMNARLGKQAGFSSARFGDEASFYKALFGDDARFMNAIFGDQARFWDARFGDDAGFGDARFGYQASFWGTRFCDEASFMRARFDDGVSFFEAHFGDEARFWDAHFGDQAGFEDARFGDEASFSSARFDDGVSFFETHFGDDASFSSARFGDDTRFDYAHFGDQADFESTRFGDQARFEIAHFGDDASFYKACLGDDASFYKARFGDEASFESAEFGDKVSFVNAHFGDSAWFVQTTFEGTVDWRGVQGRERAYAAQGGPQGQEQSFSGELFRPAAPKLIFENTTFDGPAWFYNLDLSRARFEQVDLGKVSFWKSQISRTKFIVCTWATGLENRRFLRHLENHKTGEQEKEKNQRPWLERRAPLLRLRRPRLLFDELLWRRQRVKEKPINDALDPFGWLWQALWRGLPEQQTELPKSPDDYKNIQPGDIEVLALQLKRSLEDTKDPITAGDFHFAAMEMKREKARDQGRRGRAGVLWLHKMLNGYGERYGRTMVWIALLVALSAVAYWWIGEDGLKYAPEAAPTGGLLSTLIGLLPIKLSSAGHIAPLDYLSFAMQNVLPFKFGHPILLAAKPWVRLLCFGETFIGTSLFTFFVLALRRRFRR